MAAVNPLGPMWQRHEPVRPKASPRWLAALGFTLLLIGVNLLLLAGAFALLEVEHLWAALLAALLTFADLILSCLVVGAGAMALFGRRPSR